MSRELMLLRHGKSDWSAGVDDFHRPLQDRGKRGAQQIAIWLRQQSIMPDYVITSPAERALTTAEKLCKAMEIGPSIVHKDKRIYAADVADLLAVLTDCPQKAKRIMLVGHNPGLEDLLLYLAGRSQKLPTGKLMPTAALARLTLPDKWKKLASNCAILETTIRPKALPNKFPFPSFDGAELRDRPAYYYTQSSVIPYRMQKDSAQILIIASSNMKHWVVPKGIKEPGLSLRKSAAKEAFEEAGIEGKVEDQPIGAYVYQKWGASCHVEVYPMKVTKVLPEHQWAECRRGREWVTPALAATRLNQSELASMVRLLAKRLQR